MFQRSSKMYWKQFIGQNWLTSTCMKVLKSLQKKITSNKLLVKTFKISSSSFFLNYIGQKNSDPERHWRFSTLNWLFLRDMAKLKLTLVPWPLHLHLGHTKTTLILGVLVDCFPSTPTRHFRKWTKNVKSSPHRNNIAQHFLLVWHLMVRFQKMHACILCNSQGLHIKEPVFQCMSI